MRYLSVCSGVEAATVAWSPLGWRPVAFSEVDPFCSAVLAHRWPEVPNLGDVEAHREWPDLGPVDLLVGGTPCQSFSVAGLRRGLDDPRGNLALVYLGLADRLRPRWLVWENVPGALSSSGGRDLGALLGAMAELGYGFAWRVLDAQRFGLAQRRKRLFVVGSLGGWRGPAEVLLEPEGAGGDTREVGEAGSVGQAAGGPAEGPRGLRAYVKAKRAQSSSDDESWADGVVSPTLTPFDQGDSRATTVVVGADGRPRRLTPRECERLQGLPDDHTAVPWRGRPAEECPDGPRYRAVSNSMPVPVMRWIGERVAVADRGA